jgi:hypothetical protein
MDEDAEVTITLPLRKMRAIIALVEGGIYRDVWPILGPLYAQVNAQIFAANERAAAQAAQEEIRAAEAASGSMPRESSTEPESAPEQKLFH